MKKTTMAQSAREANVKAIVEFFKSGIQEEVGRLGIELEHLIAHGEENTAVSYSQDHGIAWLLEQLKSEYPETTYDPEGDILGVARPSEAITIEPAAQVELSAGPFECLVEAEACFTAFEEILAETLAKADNHPVFWGYHPTAQAIDLELIPKQRYEFMNRYLGAISMYGPCMMRGSASTQVSIDYSSVDDCLRKLRLSFAISPILALMTDNSPVFEGKPRTHELVRTKLWQECDPDRCGVVPGVMDAGFTLEKYAEYILDTPAILVQNNDSSWRYEERTFGEIYAEEPMTQAQLEHALSMFFTDVRLKTYIEIRPADAMPIPYVMAYAALIKGLFYAPESLDALDTLFVNVDEAAIEEAKNELMAHGYNATVYGRPTRDYADLLMALAKSGLCEKERPYLRPLIDLVTKRTTLASLQD